MWVVVTCLLYMFRLSRSDCLNVSSVRQFDSMCYKADTTASGMVPKKSACDRRGRRMLFGMRSLPECKAKGKWL